MKPEQVAQEKHRQAMEIMDEIEYNRDLSVRKDPVKLAEAATKAFPLEKEAAQMIPMGVEPTRSVLYRSAGWLAINMGDAKTALEMAEEGLKGAIHGNIIDELEELKTEAKKLL